MILVPLPYKLYGVFRHMFYMENELYKSKSQQGVANLLCYYSIARAIYRYTGTGYCTVPSVHHSKSNDINGRVSYGR